MIWGSRLWAHHQASYGFLDFHLQLLKKKSVTSSEVWTWRKSLWTWSWEWNMAASSGFQMRRMHPVRFFTTSGCWARTVWKCVVELRKCGRLQCKIIIKTPGTAGKPQTSLCQKMQTRKQKWQQSRWRGLVSIGSHFTHLKNEKQTFRQLPCRQIWSLLS